MQLKPNVAFCPVCHTPKSGNELVCSQCGSRACPSGHPMTSKICRLCGWEDRSWKPPSQAKTYNPSVQVPGLQKAPDAREDVCPQCKVRTVFTSGSCPNCGYIFETQGTIDINREPQTHSEQRQNVVHQQMPITHNTKLEYICPRCRVKADPRTNNCTNCGYIGSMSYSLPQYQAPSHEITPVSTPVRQPVTPPRPPVQTQKDTQTRPCPTCGASVPVDSRYCWQCAGYCGLGRRSTAQSFPIREIEKTKNSIVAGMSSPSPIYRTNDGAAISGYNTAPPYIGTQRDIPITDLEYPGETGRGHEQRRKKGGERREKAYPGAKRGFPTGLLAAIIVVAVALAGMIIFVVSQIVSPSSSSSVATPAIDKTPPVISGVSVVNVTNTSATIEWTTDEKATSQVMLCFNDTCTYTPPDSKLVKNHSVIVNDIELGVPYKITVISQDSSGNEKTEELEQKFTTTNQQATATVGLAVGNQAPDFTLKDLNGNDVSLGSLKGKIVIINFWATTCAPCVAELPYFQQIRQNWTTKPLEILAINLGETGTTVVQPFVSSKGYIFTVLLDSSGTVKSTYQVTSWPRTFFIDANGIIKVPVKIGEFGTKTEIEAILNSM